VNEKEQEKRETLDTEPQAEETVATPEQATEQETVEQAAPLTEQTTADMQREIEDLENRLLRLHADFDNYRKRVLREREDTVTMAEAALLKGLLPVLDNFERALASLPEAEAAWAEGIRLVHRQLQNFLGQQGLQPIACQDQQFDPNLHEAIMRDENSDAEDGVILQELQRGYQYKGKLLRPSLVKVASKG
jgi:molecular chaperone GrpE